MINVKKKCIFIAKSGSATEAALIGYHSVTIITIISTIITKERANVE